MTPPLRRRLRSRLLALGALAIAAGAVAPRAHAIDFSVQSSVEMTSPVRKSLVYRLKLGGKTWHFTLPGDYRSTGGGELRIFSDSEPQASIVWQESSASERLPLDKPEYQADSKQRTAAPPRPTPATPEAEKKAQADREALFRRLLPPQAENVRLVQQTEETLPVNGLHNYELTFTYQLFGTNYQHGFLVNRASDRDYFTAVTLAPADRYNSVHTVLIQMLSTANVGQSDDTNRGGPTVRRMGGMGGG